MNMEHIIKIAFWIVIFSVCLPSKCFPVNIRDSNIELMRTDVKCLADSIFYTPSNVETRCLTAALECFMTELKGTAKKECEDSDDVIQPAIDFLKHTIQKIKSRNNDGPTESSECYCESWVETPFKNFLEKMEDLLQNVFVTHPWIAHAT